MKSWLRVPIHGGAMLIDISDFLLYTSGSWHVSDTGYAVNRGGLPKRTIRFHRLVAHTPAEKFTDHLNHDKLDNRSDNLRVVTQSENMRNKTDQGKGYWYQQQNNNWVVEINGVHRGTFASEIEAAEFARLVRAGLADMKPKEVRTRCRHGHSLSNAYNYGNGARCRTCQSIRSAAYFKRKQGLSK